MDAFWIIKSSFSLCGTELARNQQENYPTFMMIFQVCPVYVQKMQEKVSKSWNMDKSGLGKYVTINFGHFLLSYNPFWQSCNFLDTIGPSRSVCISQWVQEAKKFKSWWSIFILDCETQCHYSLINNCDLISTIKCKWNSSSW